MATQKKKKKDPSMLDQIGRDIQRSRKTAETVLPLNPSSRVDASRSVESQNLLNQLQSLSDPRSGAFAGGRSAEVTDFLNRLKESTAGYDSSEYGALRESRIGGLTQGFQTGRAGLARGQNAAGLGVTQRTAQLAELAKSFGRDRANAENDIFLKSADEKQKRLETYGNTVQDTETSEFDRGQSALKNYSSQLGVEQTNEYDKQKTNLEQEAKDKATKVAGILGTMGILESRRNAKQQAALTREQINASKRSGSSGTASNPYADALANLFSNMFGGTQNATA